MSILILLSIALTALVGALCTMVYTQQRQTLSVITMQQQKLTDLEVAFREVSSSQSRTNKRIDQLATDVLQREIYKSADDRHQLAIQSAKQGRSLAELIQRHGLSSDEAALVISLHAPQSKSEQPKPKNANLVDPTKVDLV